MTVFEELDYIIARKEKIVQETKKSGSNTKLLQDEYNSLCRRMEKLIEAVYNCAFEAGWLYATCESQLIADAVKIMYSNCVKYLNLKQLIQLQQDLKARGEANGIELIWEVDD